MHLLSDCPLILHKKNIFNPLILMLRRLTTLTATTCALAAYTLNNRHQRKNILQLESPIEFLNNSQQELYPVLNTAPNDTRKRLVILGSGWGAVGIMKHLDPELYAVTVISPTNYFMFTPLLPSATVGTVEMSSLVEPVRKILHKFKHTQYNALYLQAEAMSIDKSSNIDNQRTVLCKSQDGSQFYVPFDKLVIAVGGRSSTFGVPGVQEHCEFLKTAHDVRRIKTRILHNFEVASLPTTTTDEQKKQLLSFVVCGGGPTGVEFAAEVYDFLSHDLVFHFPALRDLVQVHIVQSNDHILNTYDLKISKLAEEKFSREGINVITKTRVVHVRENEIEVNDKSGKSHKLPFGLCIWTTGIGMHPFTEQFVDGIKEQNHSRAISVDDHLNVIGASFGADHQQSVWAIGDCSTISIPMLVPKLMDIFKQADKDNSDSISFAEFTELSQQLLVKHPQLGVLLHKLDKLFKQYDQDKNGSLDHKELELLLTDLEQKLKPLPGTAQVAEQEGKFVASMLNWQATQTPDKSNSFPPFVYKHFGSLAYIGSETAALDFGNGITMGGKFGAMLLWRSVYLSEQVSMRQRINLAMDWIRASLFGRDVCTFDNPKPYPK